MNQAHWLIGVNLAAQACDVGVDDVVERGAPARLLPDLTRQRVARYDLTLAAHQVLEQLELSHGELYGLTTVRDLTGGAIDGERTQADTRDLARRPATQERPYTGEQLGDCERLSQIVIRPGIQPKHAVLQRVT